MTPRDGSTGRGYHTIAGAIATNIDYGRRRRRHLLAEERRHLQRLQRQRSQRQVRRPAAQRPDREGAHRAGRRAATLRDVRPAALPRQVDVGA